MRVNSSLKPGIWGAVIGAAAISVIGFSLFGWTLGSTAERMAKERAQTAVVDVLAPICVDKFRHAQNADANLVKLNAIGYSWDKGTYVSQGGWATLPGNNEPNSAVAQACAEMLANAAK